MVQYILQLSITIKNGRGSFLVVLVAGAWWQNVPQHLGVNELYSSVESHSTLLYGSADTEIVKRNLITDFLSATSIPVNVPLHR